MLDNATKSFKRLQVRLPHPHILLEDTTRVHSHVVIAPDGAWSPMIMQLDKTVGTKASPVEPPPTPPQGIILHLTAEGADSSHPQITSVQMPAKRGTHWRAGGTVPWQEGVDALQDFRGEPGATTEVDPGSTVEE